MSKLTSVLLWGATAIGAFFLIRKTVTTAQLAKSVSFAPYIDGTPKVSSGVVKIPVGIEITNPSSGSISVTIDSASVSIGDTIAASLTLPDGGATVEIAANSTSTLSDMYVSVSLTSLLTIFASNIYNIINGNFQALKEKMRIDGQATIGNSLEVTFGYSFATSTSSVSGLGVVASGSRTLKPFSDYSAFLPPRSELEKTDKVIIYDGSTSDTVHFMKQVVNKTLSDTATLAKWLKRSTVKETVQSVWDFVYNYIQYERDSTVREQVRRPLRTLYDRAGDCDCYATLCASIFENLGISWKFRIAKYYNRDYFQHVYVIVPDGNIYYTCDPVMDACFEEKEPTETKDF